MITVVINIDSTGGRYITTIKKKQLLLRKNCSYKSYLPGAQPA